MSSLELERLVDKVMEELERKLGQRSHGSVEGQSEQRNLSTLHSHGTDLLLFEETEQGRTSNIPAPKWKEGLDELVASTPARIGVWRTGTRPLTRTMLQLRIDHAAAVDAVYGEVSESLLQEFSLFSVETTHENTETYLKRPDLGRIITEQGVQMIKEKCKHKPQVQVVVSDGLSASAVEANLRDVYPALLDSLKAHGLTAGTPFFL